MAKRVRRADWHALTMPVMHRRCGGAAITPQRASEPLRSGSSQGILASRRPDVELSADNGATLAAAEV